MDPPPPGTHAFTAKKGKFEYRKKAIFFPMRHGLLEKRGGLVPAYVFIFPENGAFFNLDGGNKVTDVEKVYVLFSVP